MVVLAVDPGRIGKQFQKVAPAVLRCRQGTGIVRQSRILVDGSGNRPVIQGGVFAEGDRGHVTEDGAVEPVEDPEPSRSALGRLGDPAHHCGPHLPLGADLLDPGQVGRGHDGQHPLLALRRHDLVVDHSRLAAGHSRHIHIHPHTAASGRLAGGAHQPCSPEVLDPHHELGVEQFEAGLDQALLLIGVADLHARALGRFFCLVPAAEAGRRQDADPADAIAPGGRAQQHGQVARSGCLAEHEAVRREHAHAQHVDQRVLRVAGVKGELAADGRDADRISVAGNAGDDAFDQPLLTGFGGVTEEQRVHHGDRPGPHGEDVPQDAAHTGSRTLVGLYCGGVVVRLDPDGHSDTVTGVDHPGVLPWPDQHVRSFGGQPFEMHP